MAVDAGRRAVGRARGHPRHLVLAALVAGLLATLAGPPLVLGAAAAFAALAGRSWLAAVVAAAALTGALAGQARLDALDAGVLAHLDGRDMAADAILLEPVRDRAVGPAVARAKLVDGPAAGEQAVLRINGYGGAWPGVGDEVRVLGTVAPLDRYDAYQRRRNAHAAIDVHWMKATGRRRGGLAGRLDAVRRRAEAGLNTGLAPPEAALLRGMVLGEDERLSDAVRTDFQRSGLAHILAVSGENVMLLAALVLGACALTGVPLRTRLTLTAAAIALYVPLAGGGPSIQRAGVMGLAGLAAALAGRPARRWYALLLAAAATLLLNPRTAGEPGWQLSFLAVVALLAGATPLRKALATTRLPRAVADPAAITLAATAGTAPLMALQFQQVSLASLPANLLAAPAIAPVMWLGMLAVAVAQLSPALAGPFTAACAPLLVYIERVAHVTASAPLAAVAIHAGPVPVAAATALTAAVVALAVVGWRRTAAARAEAALLGVPVGRRRLTRPRTLAAGAVVAAALALAGARVAAARRFSIAPGELVVSFLDIGQGDATLLQLAGHAVLVDTGPPDGPILRRLSEAHVRDLDALLLTHAQADHEGAALAVLRAHPTALVIDGGAGWKSRVQRALPRALAAGHARELVPRAGEVVKFGPLRLKILWPPPPDGPLTGDPNERAVVALAQDGKFKLLLTADAESDITGPLELPRVDALKVAHHGSADPGLPALLARLRPQVAAIEVGRHNDYGHPTPSTLKALRVVPHVYRTDRDGTVRLYVLGGRMWVGKR